MRVLNQSHHQSPWTRRRYVYLTTGSLADLIRCDSIDCLTAVAAASGPLDIILIDAPDGGLVTHPAVAISTPPLFAKLAASLGGHAVHPARIGKHTATLVIGAGTYGRLCE